MTVASAEELLRSYEPILRFTEGELFFPTAVDPYVSVCSLWEFRPDGTAHCRVPAGELDLDRLVAEADPRSELSLRYVESPLTRRELRAWRRRPERPRLRRAGRFTEVGLIARLIDALFRLSLLLRGRVPGGLAAAAEVTYRTRLEPQRHTYYGRVQRDGGYVVLQYWFFYVMNDWRSSFGGANDHEADWEHVTVYLAASPDGGLSPAWVACSAHDEIGDDLRRRWDDPELTREGDHVVVFPGAGSHSGAFVAGDYLTAVEPGGLGRTALRLARLVAKVFAPWARGEVSQGVGIPLVDYSRGDGEAIGPGSPRSWAAETIDDATPWVRDFRGLWGLDTQDRFGGERAPAGPRYERDGTIRQSWADPIGWVGLHKVPASAWEEARLLGCRLEDLDAEIERLDVEIERVRSGLRQATTLEQHGWAAAWPEHSEAEVADLVARRAALDDERGLLARHPLERSAEPTPQAHLRRKVSPIGSRPDQRSRFLQVWSTISTPLLLAAMAYLLFDHDVAIVTGMAVFLVVFLAVESVARGQFIRFVVSIVLVIATTLVVLAAVRGLLGQVNLVLALLLAVASAVALVVNVRDLRR